MSDRPAAQTELTIKIDDADLPPDMLVRDTSRSVVIGEIPAEDDDEDGHAAGGAVEDEAGGEESDGDADRAEGRIRRRSSRRAREREARAREAAQLESLRLQLQDAQAQIGELRGAGTYSRLAQIDAAIQEAANGYRNATAHHSQAVDRAEGPRATEAAKAMASWQARHSALMASRQALVQNSQREASGIQPVDQRTASHADTWIRKNPWYDPHDTNQDSRVASAIDTALATEGFDPRLQSYWQELDRRLSVALPHRYGGREARAREDDMADAGGGQRAPVMVAGGGRERAPVNGGGSERAPGRQSPGTYRLSAERVAVAKEAGIWGDEKRMRNYITECMNTDRALAAEQPRDRR